MANTITVTGIEGMSCTGCSKYIQESVQKKFEPSLRSVSVNFESKTLTADVAVLKKKEAVELVTHVTEMVRKLNYKCNDGTLNLCHSKDAAASVIKAAQVTVVGVKNMSCESCCKKIADGLAPDVPGVAEVEGDVGEQTVVVDWKAILSGEQETLPITAFDLAARVVATLEKLEYGWSAVYQTDDKTKKIALLENKKVQEVPVAHPDAVAMDGADEAAMALVLTVSGMSCASCAASLENGLKKVACVKGVTVNFATLSASVQVTSAATAESDVLSAVADLGYSASLRERRPIASSQQKLGTNTERLRFVVEGMFCISCPRRIEQRLSKIEGVKRVNANYAIEEALVEFDSQLIPNHHVFSDHLTDLGFTLVQVDSTSDKYKDSQFTLSLLVEGMSCASCAARIESELKSHDGVLDCTVNFATSSASIKFESTKMTTAQLITIIESLGYQCKVLSSESGSSDAAASDTKRALERTREITEQKKMFLLSLIGAIPLSVIMIIHFFWSDWYHDNCTMMYSCHVSIYVVEWVLATPVVFYCGLQFFARAFASLKHCTFTMDSLIAIGVGGAYFFSTGMAISDIVTHHKNMTYFDTAALLISFMLLGRFLEAVAKRSTSSALIKLLSLAPATALLVRDHGPDVEVPAASLHKGDKFRVLPGDRVAADGVLLEGECVIDEQMVTGESLPRVVKIGEKVIGGTLNMTHAVVIQATKVGEETMLSQILRIVQDAQQTKPAIQRVADAIASVFVPIVIVFSLLIFVVWLILGATDAYPAHWRGMDSYPILAVSLMFATLVAACPCALGLATPTAVMVGTGIGAQNGVLIKGGPTLEAARSITCILFDKTGTLTKGELAVVAVLPQGNVAELDTVFNRQLIGSIQERSLHPIAKAITAHLGTLPPEVEFNCSVEAVAGLGVSATVILDQSNTVEVKIGSMKYLLKSNIAGLDDSVKKAADDLATNGTSPVLASINGQIAFIFGVADEPKPEAYTVVTELQKRGIKVMLVSGDNPAVAQHVGALVGLSRDCVYAGVLPGEKSDVVKEQQANGHVVGFVGDGINDTPALTQADVGIAVGAGTEVAIDSADAVLVHSSLWDILTFLDLSAVTVRRIYINFVWATVYNFIMLPLAAGALLPVGVRLPPVVAGAAMVLSSLSVLSSSLALRCFSPQERTLVARDDSSQQKKETTATAPY